MDLGDGPIQAVGTGDDDEDIFISLYGTDGSPVKSKSFGGPGRDQLVGVKSDDSGGVIITGTHEEEIVFDDQKLDVPDGGFGNRMFVAKLEPP